MKTHLVHAFEDNFIFVIEINGCAIVVDPGEAHGVLQFLAEKKLRLQKILLTHCHHDHIGGVKELLASRGKDKESIQILGPKTLQNFDIHPDVVLNEGVNFEFQNSNWQTYHLPGHTLDHLVYYNQIESALFCGDVLFSLGCGRLFEGSFEQAFNSLKRIKSLPPDTRIFCTHEYTLANCQFHISEDLAPREEYLRIKESLVERLAIGQDSIPTRLGFELKYNSLLRTNSLKEFTELRTKRNHFKYVINREPI